MSTATIDDVARRAGVSIKTVSRVLNGEPLVRDSTRDKVRAAISELGYRPNASARRLAGKRTYLLGLVYQHNSSYASRVQAGVLDACHDHHYELLIHPCRQTTPDALDDIRELAQSGRVDGLLMTPPVSDIAGVRKLLEKLRIPNVVLSRVAEDHAPWSVGTNDRDISRNIVEHLVSLGHSRILYVRGHPDHKAMANRYQGYLDGMATAGLKALPAMEGDNAFDSGRDCGAAALSAKTPPTAIVCANDHMAAGVIRAAYEAGVTVPDALSVAGFDDIPLAGQLSPGLTTVRQPMERMARTAAELLIERVRNPGLEDNARVLASRLVLRDSTGPAPG